MDSIRSPGRLLKLHQESTWSASGVHLECIRSPPGVHLESIRSPPGVHLDLSQGSNHCALPRNPARLQVYSRYTPAGLLMESIRMETIPGLLIQSCQNPSRTPHIVQVDSTHANLINCYCQKTNVSTQIRTQDLCSTNNDACNHSANWPQRLSNNKE